MVTIKLRNLANINISQIYYKDLVLLKKKKRRATTKNARAMMNVSSLLFKIVAAVRDNDLTWSLPTYSLSW